MSDIYSKEYTSFTNVQTLATSVITEMLSNGFTLLTPAILPPVPVDLIELDTFSVRAVLVPTSTVDMLATNLTTPNVVTQQPYYIYISYDIDNIDIHVGTSTTIEVIPAVPAVPAVPALPDTPSSVMLAYTLTGTVKTYPGLVGISAVGTTPDQPFIDRSNFKTNEIRAAHPMCYRISIAKNASTTLGANGIGLVYWEPGTDDTIDTHSWMIVQRSVNTISDGGNRLAMGMANIYGKSPVYCLYGMYRPAFPAIAAIPVVYKPYTSPAIIISAAVPAIPAIPILISTNKFIVRELDIVKPSSRYSTYTTTSLDNITNTPYTQSTIVSTMEDGSYNVCLVGSLATSRYVYPRDELDLIGYVSADVVSTGKTMSFTMYGESVARQYYTFVSTGANNTGIRFFMRIA